ncbi:hypothetical protein [Thiofilum flexile]|uniref:hypothetical protein n=1 Tax=Thiofilum flexile TaxID=125627 RepID=UPI000367A6FA|nr:hypothetical protein [Thiofilum flexile]
MRKKANALVFAVCFASSIAGYAATQDQEVVEVEAASIESLNDLAIDDYPIKTDPLKLGAAKDVNEALKSTQVSEDDLKKYNSQKLIKLAVSYPGAFMYLASNSPQQGIDTFVKTSSMVQELYSRKDAPKELLKFYSRFDHKLSTSNLSEDKKNKVIIKLVNLTNIIGQYEVLDQLTDSQIKKLIDISYKNLVDMNDVSQEKYFDDIAKGSNALLLLRAMVKKSPDIVNNLTQDSKSFLKTGGQFNSLINNEIINIAQIDIIYKNNILKINFPVNRHDDGEPF